MNVKLRLAAIGILLLFAAGLYSAAKQYAPRPPAQSGTVCTQEAKQCPDGSSVGRTGPDCSFAPCPAATTSGNSGGQGSGAGTGVYDSGIRGTVMLGPTCPVQRVPPDPQCAPKPYATLIAVFPDSDPAHAEVLTRSAADGTFSVSVPPGRYTLGAGESALPRCDHPSVTVVSGAYATAAISCDTGIR